jgi:hypothetical protein
MKFCKNCKWFYHHVLPYSSMDLCKYPYNITTEPVRGYTYFNYPPASLRSLDYSNTCGPEGRWWEPIQ